MGPWKRRIHAGGHAGKCEAIEQRELEEVGARIILGNTYHLYLRPGIEVVREAEDYTNLSAGQGRSSPQRRIPGVQPV